MNLLRRVGRVLLLIAWLSLPAHAQEAVSFPEPFDFSGLQLFLVAHPEITTVDDFLRQLPSDYRKYYALVRASRSLQGASVTQPRVIGMTTRENLTFAFTGSEQQEHGNTVEMVQYRPSQRAYEFRELVFGAGAPALSSANPPLCLSCHGSDPRPIWSPYPFWTGAFGEFRNNGTLGDAPQIVAAEEDFIAKMSGLPRYSALVPFNKTSFSHDLTAPNIALSRLFYASNYPRLSRVLQATPYYDAYKYAVIGALLCYPKRGTPPESFLKRFLPDSLRAAHLAAFRPEYRHDSEVGPFLYWDYLFEPRGISTVEWPNQFGPLNPHSGNRFSDADLITQYYTGRAYVAAYWFLQYEKDVAALLGDSVEYGAGPGTVGLPLTEFRSVSATPVDEEACGILSSRSQQALSDLLKTVPLETIVPHASFPRN